MPRPTSPLILALLLCAPSFASDVRPADRVLLVSTRPVGCSTDAARLENGVYAAEFQSGAWRRDALDTLFSSLDPATPVVVYIHGNQEEASDARRRGLDVYRRLIRCAEDERPIQFVVFSWCSGKVPGLLRDYREKAARTKPVAWQVAWVLDRLPDGASVGLLGYSYGARIVSGSAHLLAGGSLGALCYSPPSECSPCRFDAIRAVYLAAAYDACWNARGRYHGRALDTIDTVLVTVNSRDPAMRFYKWVSRSANPPAAGGVGLRGLDASQAPRVRRTNVAGSVGKSHDLYRYLAAPGLMREAWRRLAFVHATASTRPQVAQR